jgi:hypothetical protein
VEHTYYVDWYTPLTTWRSLLVGRSPIDYGGYQAWFAALIAECHASNEQQYVVIINELNQQMAVA